MDISKTFIVYCLISPSNKIYIGMSSKSLSSRFKKHISHWRGKDNFCVKLCRAFDKYPPELWRRFVLFHSSDRKEAEKAEVHLIKVFNSVRCGYNVLPGGKLSRFGIPNVYKGKRLPESHRLNISKSLIGNTYSLGHKQTEEHKKKSVQNRR